MATSFHSAALAAHNAIRSNRGLAVTYRRGETEVEVTAVPARSRITIEDESGLSVRSVHRDWIVRAADLVLGGQVVAPLIGDTIRLGVGEPEPQEVQVFEVQPLARGESHVAPCDDLGRVLRIHTRQVATEPVSDEDEE